MALRRRRTAFLSEALLGAPLETRTIVKTHMHRIQGPRWTRRGPRRSRKKAADLPIRREEELCVRMTVLVPPLATTPRTELSMNKTQTCYRSGCWAVLIRSLGVRQARIIRSRWLRLVDLKVIGKKQPELVTKGHQA